MEVVDVADTQKVNRAAEKLAESTKDSYQKVIDHAVGLQERNVRFVQGIGEGYTNEIRQQAESNRALAKEFAEKAEKQRGAFQSLVQESVDAYIEFVFAPFSHYKEGLQVAKKVSA